MTFTWYDKVTADALFATKAALTAGYVSFGTTPPDPAKAPVWVDTSTTPQIVKGWSGSTWVAIGGGAQNSAGITDFVEAAQDAAASMFRAGTNVTFVYDDAANTFTINSTGGGTGTTDAEVVRDTIGAALVAGQNVQITVNDPADSITIAVTGLAPVATSGSYADLTNKPTIPTVLDASTSTKGVVQLTGDLGGTATAPTVPALTSKAPLASPAFTGAPTVPTAAGGTNTTQAASTAFVSAAVSAVTLASLGGITPAAVDTKFGTWGIRPTLYYSGTAWPSTRTVPSGYSGPVDWDSQGYTGVTAPAAAIDGDRWIGETV